jgi:hypothetical protein
VRSVSLHDADDESPMGSQPLTAHLAILVAVAAAAVRAARCYSLYITSNTELLTSCQSSTNPDNVAHDSVYRLPVTAPLPVQVSQPQVHYHTHSLPNHP